VHLKLLGALVNGDVNIEVVPVTVVAIEIVFEVKVGDDEPTDVGRTDVFVVAGDDVALIVCEVWGDVALIVCVVWGGVVGELLIDVTDVTAVDDVLELLSKVVVGSSEPEPSSSSSAVTSDTTSLLDRLNAFSQSDSDIGHDFSDSCSSSSLSKPFIILTFDLKHNIKNVNNIDFISIFKYIYLRTQDLQDLIYSHDKVWFQ
jgi:hypothetical protein